MATLTGVYSWLDMLYMHAESLDFLEFCFLGGSVANDYPSPKRLFHFFEAGTQFYVFILFLLLGISSTFKLEEATK